MAVRLHLPVFRPISLNRGVFDEQTSGLEFYWFVKDLVDNFDSKYQSIVG